MVFLRNQRLVLRSILLDNLSILYWVFAETLLSNFLISSKVSLKLNISRVVIYAHTISENVAPVFVSYESAKVVSVTPTILNLTADISTVIGQTYFIYRGYLNELENVTLSKITMLQNTMLTSPNRLFPAYTQEGNILTSYPEEITAGVTCQYFRYPFQPRWTYTTLAGGEPVFNPNDPDYQDFELPLDDQMDLTMTILQYCGVSIRELEVYKYAQAQQMEEEAKEKLT